jgi:hypothetical protein
MKTKKTRSNKKLWKRPKLIMISVTFNTLGTDNYNPTDGELGGTPS